MRKRLGVGSKGCFCKVAEEVSGLKLNNKEDRRQNRTKVFFKSWVGAFNDLFEIGS